MSVKQGSTRPNSPQVRNPEDRRQRIVEAAAELLTEGGGRLTHRLVAQRADVPLGSTTYYFATLDDLVEQALQHLAVQTDAELDEVAQALADSDGSPEAIAALMHEHLQDADRVRTETTLYAAGIERPELREISRRWFKGLVAVLSEFVDTETAQLMAVFADGVTLHASLHDEPIDRAAIERVTRLLLAGSYGTSPDSTVTETEKS
ncbi:putative TetR family transcriptional regulator [Gordonia araii NBRC 100433]|uniref:Putative TetR family transcriptional regulator n=1 Tax=Gordonia araii NBRC 100433 TaxID=1073574 RepID=G7H315_9ACTN|nr:TetR family transcriptional regulator [Gordonia araii]NNG97333.1 TetR family transcriptional regulator [Gordonia araii NBRC 100433]GAB10240.1 putative TetR family transcriptional regulator [Gordonia araii NBRC 100433]